MAMASSPSPKEFEFHASVAKFNVPFEDLLTTLNSTIATPLDGLGTGAVVFSWHHNGPPRILLLQRSSTDSMPNKWEIPGGAVDAGETVLHGAVREVAEESGLVVTRITGLVVYDESEGKREAMEGVEGGYLFRTTRGKRVVKFTFVVEVESGRAVNLDPNEHQDYVWATEYECRAKKVERSGQDGRADVALEFTTGAQEAAIMKAFSESTIQGTS